MKFKTVKEHIEENDVTLYSLAWSMLWRGWVLVMLGYLAALLVVALFAVAYGF